MAARFLLAQALALWLTLMVVAPTYRIGALDLEVRLRPTRQGTTEIMLPPLGRVSAPTHTLPVTVSLLPTGVQVRSLQALVTQLTQSRTTLTRMQQDLRRAARVLVLHLMLVTALAAAAAATLIGPRSLRRSLSSGAAGGGLVLLGCAWLAADFEASAFRRPRYTGVLSEAQNVIRIAERGFADLGKVQSQLQYAATNLARFYRRLETLPAAAARDRRLRVLHVSDLHNNRLGLDLIRTLAQEYDVKLIVGTGDFTDYGSPLESRLLAAWRQIPVPTLFVSGNHDSRATIAALRRLPNVEVLEGGEPVERLGLQFAGWADPVSERPGAGEANYAPGALEELESHIRGTLAAMPRPPDVLLLHNYRVAEPLAGLAPVILYGHDHRARVTQRDGSVLVDAGTTGAAGVRFFTVAEPPPYTAAMLSFDPTTPPRLAAVDLIEVRQPEGSFSIQHFPVD